MGRTGKQRIGPPWGPGLTPLTDEMREIRTVLERGFFLTGVLVIGVCVCVCVFSVGVVRGRWKRS